MLPAFNNVCELIPQQVPDTLDGHVRYRVFREFFRVVGIFALSREHGGHAIAPSLLDRAQYARLVIDHDVMLRRIPLLDIIQCSLFVDIDKHVTLNRLGNAGAFDLSRLKDHISVGKNHGFSPRAKSLQHIERSRVETIGEGVVHQVRRHRQQMNVSGMLNPISLQSP